MTQRPTRETIRLEDMRLFAVVAQERGFTRAARRLAVPKQTLSRRVGELERALGVQLLHRTTRRLHLTDVGSAYAERCAQIAALADEANRAVTDTHETPTGLLRITADPVFGDAFVGPIVIEHARRWPQVEIEVVLTRRSVHVIEEGFDVAFRVGRVDHAALSATALGPARVRYCASRSYLRRRGAPARPRELAAHDNIVVSADAAPVRWPFRGRKGVELVPVSGRLRVNSFAMAHAAALAGLGIAIFPEFACAADLRRRRLVAVLDDWTAEVGGIWMLHPPARYLAARVRTFLELACERLRPLGAP